jgi:DNA-binding transcriptional MerR regulator
MTVAQMQLSLDLLGIGEGTDKSSLAGDYLRHYEEIFSSLRHEKFNLIEIGVFHGASVRLWPRFFTAATVIGVDIDPRCRAYENENERVKIEIGSQADPEFLHKLASAYPPRIVIDDGSHRSDHNIFTFEHLFPAVVPGGYYVIEDIHFHLDKHEAERLRGASPVLATDYFGALAKDRMGGVHYTSALQGFQRYAANSIDSIQVIAQAFIIRKKDKVHDGYAADMVRQQVAHSNDWLNWLRFGLVLQERGQPLAEVVEALRHAVELNKAALITYHRLSEVLEQMGDYGASLTVLKQCRECAECTAEQIADLESRMNRTAQKLNQKLSQ